MHVFLGTEIAVVTERILKSLATVVDCELNVTFNGMRGPIQIACDLKYESGLEQSCHDIMMTHALLSERMCPGTFKRCIQNIRLHYDGTPSLTTRNNFCETLGGRRPSIDDIQSIIEHFSSDRPKWVRTMIHDALIAAGFVGKILVEKVESSMPSIELVSGYAFNATSHIKAYEMLESPKVCVIDGFVESVSEIHHLLEAASSRKQALILYARNFSDDVKNTLSVNYARGTLKVIPYTVPFDLEGANVLVDISIVAGCDLVSSLKGDLISSIKFDELPSLLSANTYSDKTILTNSATSVAVSSHVRKLRNRRATDPTEKVTSVLDARIRSLTPSQVVVRLPEDLSYVMNAQAFDRVLRAVKSAIDHGVSGEETIELAASEVATRMYSSKCAELLRDLGAVVKL